MADKASSGLFLRVIAVLFVVGVLGVFYLTLGGKPLPHQSAPEFSEAYRTEMLAAAKALDDPKAALPPKDELLFRRVTATVMDMSIGDVASLRDGRVFFSPEGWRAFIDGLQWSKYIDLHNSPDVDIEFAITKGPARFTPVIDDKYKDYPHYVAKAEMTATKLGQTKPAKMTVKCIFILEKQAGDQQALPKQILIENISCK